jgi:hypothetical protein
MSAKGESQIRTTHTGSLPRPDDLAKKIYDREGGLRVEGFDERVRLCLMPAESLSTKLVGLTFISPLPVLVNRLGCGQRR